MVSKKMIPLTPKNKKITPFKRRSQPKSQGNKIGGKKLAPKKQLLKRFYSNPILEPHQGNSWETKATFNPAAIYEDGKVHLLYRAIGESDMSALGYASSKSGLYFSERLAEPAYTPTHVLGNTAPRTSAPAIPYASGGGGWGGAEDPRIVKIGDRLYMTFLAFNGWDSARIALTSISWEDFLNKQWDWKKPVFISPPGEVHKNWVLLPEKINGKYAVLHSISPKVLIDYFDNLEELGDENYIKSYHGRSGRKGAWDNWVRGAGPPPIKTKRGWLLLYHAMDERDPNRYKLGAMLLDLRDPTKILYRSSSPVLEPDESYENEGNKPGVIYSCGAVTVKDKLLVYYGGADKFACVAEAALGEFIADLIADKKPGLKKTPR